MSKPYTYMKYIYICTYVYILIDIKLTYHKAMNLGSADKASESDREARAMALTVSGFISLINPYLRNEYL